MYKPGKKIMKKITAAGACGILTLSMLAGCGSTDTASGSSGSLTTATETEAETATETEADAVASPQADSSDSVLMGRITAIDGDTITIATMGKSGGPKGDGEAPARADGEVPEKPDGEASEMDAGAEGTASEQTITVTADTVITIDEKEAVLEDLAVDDMISVKMESGKVVSITTAVQPQDKTQD